ncbi:hypothetical protein [Paraglaciecola sp. 20A4]|uniref:hypothetical protein n=1 Tax=Paraglaciecola sp. 20A4 TaxID=2687288 RepID=UPI00197E8C7B|nr:hypothetical protein [Paraglaciecola sp. 20A4]
MAISEKDKTILLSKVNAFLSDYHARVMIEDAPEKLISFYENNAALIKGELVIVRTKADEGHAAHMRNTCDKCLFLFGEQYWAQSYFTGVCAGIRLPQALVNRVRKSNIKTEAVKRVLDLMDSCESGPGRYEEFTNQVAADFGISVRQLDKDLEAFM